MDRFRESVERLFVTLPLVHLAYLFAKLLMQRNLSSNPAEIIPLASSILSLLCTDQNPKTPLVHHFAGLVAVALVEVLQTTPTNENALRGLHDLRLWLEKGQSGSAKWDAIIINFITTKAPGSQPHPPTNGTPIDRGGLQHLADAAVCKSENALGERNVEDAPRAMDAESAADWTITPVKGYLRILNPLK